MMERCKSCHRQEFADWQAGPHGATFAQFSWTQKQNRQRLLMDDCLRCHGSQFEGGMRDLVTPHRYARAVADDGCAVDQSAGDSVPELPPDAPARRTAPQAIATAAASVGARRDPPAFACAVRPARASARCGSRPAASADPGRRAAGADEPGPASGALLPVPRAARHPAGRIGRRPHGHGHPRRHQLPGVPSEARRNHARVVRSCHPRLSNCGLDVEKMDTTFPSPKSAHNIHFVKCADCHTKGVPKRRT